MTFQGKTAAVFLDRDGTIIRDVDYLCKKEQIEILPGVPEAIRMLRRKGYKIVVVTNQSGVARGRLTEEQLREIHEELCQRLEALGAILDGIYYCPHHPSEGTGAYNVSCDCRKPNTGLILRAANELGLDPSVSYVVGDKPSDMELATRVGARGIRIRDVAVEEDKSAAVIAPWLEDLWQAARWIVGEPKGTRT
jgi:D-glycero-D-manno-heptose 1,7-bisphosphate phosphatase